MVSLCRLTTKHTSQPQSAALKSARERWSDASRVIRTIFLPAGSKTAEHKAANHMTPQLADLHEKERRIVRCGRQLAVAVFFTILSSTLNTVATRLMASQIFIWTSNAGLSMSVWLLIHAMSSYCLFSLRSTYKQELGPDATLAYETSTASSDELLTPGLQDAFDEIMGKPRARRVSGVFSGGSMLSMRSSKTAAALVAPNDILGDAGIQLIQASGRASRCSSGSLEAGSSLRRQLELVRPLLAPEAASALLTRVAGRMRDPSYSLKEFHADMVRCFPELQLYLGGCSPAADTVEASAAILFSKGVTHVPGSDDRKSSTSGRTAHVEYCRTFGALFCVYWLMRLELEEVDGSQGLGGQSGFCLGVEKEGWEGEGESLHKLSRPSPSNQRNASFKSSPRPDGTSESGKLSVAANTPEQEKRLAFLHTHDWAQLHVLMVDAGLLRRTEAGGAAVCVERTRAMLVLTAVHDVMKTECLLPTVLAAHAPFGGYREGEVIRDHDAALGYVLTHDADALPCYADLPAEQRAPVRFTQAELSFNHGWLVQAEAPPGALLTKFKQLLEGGGMSAADVAFYFVHWLTDLAGAEGTPLAGEYSFVS